MVQEQPRKLFECCSIISIENINVAHILQLTISKCISGKQKLKRVILLWNCGEIYAEVASDATKQRYQ